MKLCIAFPQEFYHKKSHEKEIPKFLIHNQNKSHIRQKLKQWPKKKKNQKTNKVQKLTETKEKGYFKKMKSIPVWGLQKNKL